MTLPWLYEAFCCLDLEMLEEANMLSRLLYKKGERELINDLLDHSCLVCSFIYLSELTGPWSYQSSSINKGVQLQRISQRYSFLRNQNTSPSMTLRCASFSSVLSGETGLFSSEKEDYLARLFKCFLSEVLEVANEIQRQIFSSSNVKGGCYVPHWEYCVLFAVCKRLCVAIRGPWETLLQRSPY